ncbi:MAG: FkbM family methyltransferase [Thaumarchaeota archaeon]|nr:FkbM family methyltransferase [Nitrososphaerota archaeon]
MTMILFGPPLPDSEFVGLITRKMIKKGDCVLEIGSNVGGLTESILKAVGNDGQVYACEPNPISFEYSTLRLGRKSNLRFFNLGLGDKISDSYLKQSWLTDKTAKSGSNAPSEPAKIMIKCKILTLDYLTERLNPKPNLILIDVEGAELDVLEGGVDTLTNSSDLKLVIELHPIERPKIVEEVLQKLSLLGYKGELFDKSDQTTTYFFERIPPSQRISQI